MLDSACIWQISWIGWRIVEGPFYLFMAESAQPRRYMVKCLVWKVRLKSKEVAYLFCPWSWKSADGFGTWFHLWAHGFMPILECSTSWCVYPLEEVTLHIYPCHFVEIVHVDLIYYLEMMTRTTWAYSSLSFMEQLGPIVDKVGYLHGLNCPHMEVVMDNGTCHTTSY